MGVRCLVKLSLESLYKDHDNLRRVLFLLEQILVEIYRGLPVNYSTLLRILTYLQDYPERAHHPAEDAIFSLFINNGLDDKKLHEDFRLLMKDHTQIEVITRDAIEIVEPLATSTHHDTSRVINALLTLLKRQRSHLLFEEANIYPHFAKYMTSEHWEQVADLIPETEDPIFGENVRDEYEVISRAL